MQFVSALFFRLMVFLFWLLPFRLIYILSDGFAFLLHHVFRYRFGVVRSNLRRAFPEKDDSEINRLVRLSYRNVADIFVESIKGFTLHPEKQVKRYKLINPEFLKPYAEKQQSVMMTAGHYGNWEWGSYFLTLQIPVFNILVLYKPLKNKMIDAYMRKRRESTGLAIRSILETSKVFEEFKTQPTIFTLIADQSPSNLTRSYWVEFMDQPTAFLHGVESYAKKYGLPVVFLDIQRVARGYYELELSLISDNPNALAEGEITALYAHKMEEVIRKKPEDWLWSHKRWKHQPPENWV
jgi:KDO2-lipid IV(A) lauroyltransferase